MISTSNSQSQSVEIRAADAAGISQPIAHMNGAQLPNNTGKNPLYAGDFTQCATLFEHGSMEMTSTDIGGSAFESNGISVRGTKRMAPSVFDMAAAVRREIQRAT